MGTTVYILCALTCLACTILLWRGYLRSRNRLLFWSTWGFCLLTINNFLLVADLVIWPGPWVDLRLERSLSYLLGLLLLIYGFIWGSD